MGIWKWVQEKASSIYQGVSNVIATAQTVIVIIGDVLSAEAFRKSFSTWFMQSWQGVLRMIDLPTTMGSTGPKTRRVWMRGEATALARLLPAVIYQAAIRPYAGTAVRAVTNNGWVEFAAVGALDLAAGYVLTRRMLAGAADNMAYGMSMAKASMIESASDAPTENRLAEACEHDNISQLTAGFNSSVYYYGNRLALYALARTLPYGEYITLPLQALFYGWTYLEYPLGAAGNCTEHRLEVLTKNNPYAFGVGATYLASHRALQFLIQYYTGANGFFIDEALSSMLSLHFIMVANVTRNLPLPGTEQGADTFYFGRAVTDLVIVQAMNYIEKKYDGTQECDWYQDLKKNMGAKWDSPVGKVLRFALLYDELQDSKKMALRPSAKMYLELCGADLENGIQGWRDMRKDSYYQTVDYFKGVLPQVMGNRRKMLSLALNKYLEDPLTVWLAFIKEVSDPKFGAAKQPPGLYAAARRDKAPAQDRVSVLPDDALVPYGNGPANTGLYSVARKRFTTPSVANSKSQVSIRPDQPLSPPSSPPREINNM